MKNLTVWQALIIAIVPALITIANSWALKWFDTSKIKEAPKKEPDAKSIEERNKSIKRSRISAVLFGIFSFGLALLSLVMALRHPLPNPDFESLLISFSVGNMFFTILMTRINLNMLSVADIFYDQLSINRHIVDGMGDFAATTEEALIRLKKDLDKSSQDGTKSKKSGKK